MPPSKPNDDLAAFLNMLRNVTPLRTVSHPKARRAERRAEMLERKGR